MVGGAEQGSLFSKRPVVAQRAIEEIEHDFETFEVPQ